MFKPPHPKRVQGKQTPKGKDSSHTERVKLTQFHSTKEKPSPSKATPKATPNKPRSNLASIFGTLLSSQESHAHQHASQSTTHRGNRSNLPDPQGPVKPTQIRRSRVGEQGLACWAVDDLSIDPGPPLTTRNPSRITMRRSGAQTGGTPLRRSLKVRSRRAA